MRAIRGSEQVGASKEGEGEVVDVEVDEWSIVITRGGIETGMRETIPSFAGSNGISGGDSICPMCDAHHWTSSNEADDTSFLGPQAQVVSLDNADRHRGIRSTCVEL
ncbi:hypothetical protein PM082_011232 [Marasmius tenuissimus]|nr:hypothetical protein PM082_011232 [Marasmius tenuissimus]